VGVGVGGNVGVAKGEVGAVGEGVGVAVAVGEGVRVGVAVWVGVGVGVFVGVGVAVAVGEAVGVGLARLITLAKAFRGRFPRSNGWLLSKFSGDKGLGFAAAATRARTISNGGSRTQMDPLDAFPFSRLFSRESALESVEYIAISRSIIPHVLALSSRER
jgi:hypothetical protein